MDSKLFKEINQLIREPDSLPTSSLFGLAGTVSLPPRLQNIGFPVFPPLLPSSEAGSSAGLLFGDCVGTSLAAIIYPDGFVAQIPVWAQPQRGPGHPDRFPHPSPGALQLSHRKGPASPFTDRQWLPAAFLRGLHIDSADVVLPIHSEVPGAAQALLLPSRKPPRTVPSFWEHWFCLER